MSRHMETDRLTTVSDVRTIITSEEGEGEGEGSRGAALPVLWDVCWLWMTGSLNSSSCSSSHHSVTTGCSHVFFPSRLEGSSRRHGNHMGNHLSAKTQRNKLAAERICLKTTCFSRGNTVMKDREGL